MDSKELLVSRVTEVLLAFPVVKDLQDLLDHKVLLEAQDLQVRLVNRDLMVNRELLDHLVL